jgi:hypothetical protein
MRPIKRRLYGWCVLSALVGLAALGIRGATVGSSSYFDGVRGLSGWLVAASVGCAIPVIGAALRSWRGDWRFHPVPWPIKLCAAASAAALISLVGVGLAVSPDLADGQRALAANDIAAARSTVEALEEQVGETREVMDLEDRVTVAEANQRVGEPRLKLLDAVAARNGAAAAGAALEARELRLEQIRELIAWHRPSEALAVLDGALSRDPGAAVAEERARAHDAAIALCGTAACRLGEATHALAAHATPARDQAVRLARDQAAAAIDLARLAHRPRGATAVLRRLQELRRVRDAAAAIAELALDDPALIASARKAVGVVAAERAAVPLLGNPREIAEELLGAATPDRVPAIELDGTTIYLALDRDGRCRGIRAIGDRQLERALASSTWPPGRLVSQAFGKPMTVASPPSGESIVRWSADGTPIVARWWDHALVELQIGDATTRRLTP